MSEDVCLDQSPRKSVEHIPKTPAVRLVGFRHLALFAVGCFLTAGLLPWRIAAQDLFQDQPYDILAQSDDEMTFSVHLTDYRLDTLTISGRPYTRLTGDHLVPFARSGQPDLPAFSVMLAVPQGGSARLVSFTGRDESVVDNIRILPVPRIEASGDLPGRFAVYIYEEDATVYGGTAVFPQSTAWLADRGRLRHQDVVRVVVCPFRYDPAGQRLMIADEVTVTVAFEGHGASGPFQLEPDAWESLYETALLNYSQGRKWRARPRQHLRHPVAANPRVKIMIDETGICRLDFDTLRAAGLPEGIPSADVFLYKDVFHEGSPDTIHPVETAIDVRDNDGDGILSDGDEIEFYFRGFYDEYGREGAEDLFFNRSIYWLSWGVGEHKRFASRSGWRDANSPSKPEHFTDHAYFEEDRYFINYPPTYDTDLFYWHQYRATVTFALPGLMPGYPSRLSTRVVSYYNEPSGKPRRAKLTILLKGCNGIQVPADTVETDIPGTMRNTISVSAGFFCEHANAFRFESWLGSAEAPGHTLDWFTVDYERRYEAYEDVLFFTNGDATGEVEFGITGFSSDDILLYDITDPMAAVSMELADGSIAPDTGGFSLTFRDSLAGAQRYVALCATSVRRISSDQINLIGLPLLREAQADYLIVAHPDFADHLGDLISRRESDGYTVVLATTEQVYDDFGNGMKSDQAIKRFIENGFFGGGAQFVLLVGDANVDRRGVLLEPLYGQLPSGVDYVPSHNRILDDHLSSPNREMRPYDNWFVSVHGPDDVYPDLYLGRLPVGSTSELEGVLDKISAFEDHPARDPWKKRLILVADDGFGTGVPGPCYLGWTGQHQFKDACDSAAIIARDHAVVAPDTIKFYLERCLADDQPEIRAAHGCPDPNITWPYMERHCTPALVSRLNAGALVMNFQGHANRLQFTHEILIQDYVGRRDVGNLVNADRPFVFLGFGCWISDFQWRAEPFIEDAIGEKFVLNPRGGACASFASGCSEYLSTNEAFNSYVLRAFFTHLRGVNPQGNPVPARVLLGEAALTALLRFGSQPYFKSHILMGDPATIIDMGPPLIGVSVGDSAIDESYVFIGTEFDTLAIVAEIRDEEAIMTIGLDMVENEDVTPVPEGDYSAMPIVDEDLVRSRAYRVAYPHIPHLGAYSLRFTATDYSGKEASFAMRVNTGSAVFFAGDKPLEEGASLVYGQHLKCRLTRPIPFAEGEIAVYVDEIPADQFSDYSVRRLDGEGRLWQVSFMPSLGAGKHSVFASAQGFQAEREFEYVPARADFYANGRILLDHDFVAPSAALEVHVRAQSGIGADDLSVALDGAPYDAEFVPDSTGTAWKATLSVELEIGSHEISVVLFDLVISRIFEITDELRLVDVSLFPNPFWEETRFFYTLSRDVDDIELSIYALSGRIVFNADMTPYAGYNEYVWDGRDMMADRVANGTYLYRIRVTARDRETEFKGWLVKLE